MFDFKIHDSTYDEGCVLPTCHERCSNYLNNHGNTNQTRESRRFSRPKANTLRGMSLKQAQQVNKSVATWAPPASCDLGGTGKTPIDQTPTYIVNFPFRTPR